MNFFDKLRRLIFGVTNHELLMKLNEVKAQIAAATAASTEAFQEISAKLTAMQTQIDDLIAGASDPEVTDEAFLADLQKLKQTTEQLKDIVPNAPPVEPPVTPPVEPGV